MSSDQMREVVFAFRPVLGRIYAEERETTLLDYSRRIYTHSQKTDHLVISAISGIVRRCLGDQVAENVRMSLEKSNYVSTVDHHGPLSHPAFFQPHLLRASLDHEEGIPATIVLSCGSVSLDNHTFPRGLFFHTEEGERVRLPFVSLHDRHVSVYGRRSFSYGDIAKNLSNITTCPLVTEALTLILEDVELYTKDTYRDQVTFLNHRLMERILPPGSDFVSITIEDVVREILCSEYLYTNTSLAQILFNTEARTQFLLNTNGIQTSHDFTRSNTTVLFWGLHHGVRVPLRIKSGILTDEVGEICIPFDSSHVQTALREESIFPNLALCLLVLSSLGMRLGGGFFQVDYLPMLILKTRQTCASMNIEVPFDDFSHFLGGDFMFLPSQAGSDVTPLDYIRNYLGVDDVVQYSQKTTVHEAIDRIIPEVYHILDNKLRNEWEGVVMNTTDSL